MPISIIIISVIAVLYVLAAFWARTTKCYRNISPSPVKKCIQRLKDFFAASRKKPVDYYRSSREFDKLPNTKHGYLCALFLHFSVAYEENIDAPHFLFDTKADPKEILRRAWGVKQRKDLIKNIEKLRVNLHRATYAAMRSRVIGMDGQEFSDFMEDIDDANDRTLFERIYNDKKFVADIDFFAWDIARCSLVTWFGYHAGYITEKEMWRIFNDNAIVVQKHFHSFEEYYTSYIDSRDFWDSDMDSYGTTTGIRRAIELIKDKKLTRNIDWDLDLGESPEVPVMREEGFWFIVNEVCVPRDTLKEKYDMLLKALKEMGQVEVFEFSNKLTQMVYSHFTPYWTPINHLVPYNRFEYCFWIAILFDGKEVYNQVLANPDRELESYIEKMFVIENGQIESYDDNYMNQLFELFKLLDVGTTLATSFELDDYYGKSFTHEQYKEMSSGSGEDLRFNRSKAAETFPYLDATLFHMIYKDPE